MSRLSAGPCARSPSKAAGRSPPPSSRPIPRAAGDGVNFADPKGVTRLTLTEVDQDAGAIEEFREKGKPGTTREVASVT